MSVYLDGSSLSALLFSNLNSPGNQYGILLGKHVEEVQDRISDSQIHTSDIKAYTSISSFIPWQSPDHIYSRNGKLNEELLEQLIPHSTDQVLIGWYSFRHQTSPRPSLKEATLHQSLSSCSQFRGDPRDFCLLLCTSSFKTNGSTHTCSHGFFRLTNGSFSHMPMSVVNLGDTTRTEYRQQSNVTLSHSTIISSIFAKSRKEFVHPSEEMDQVQKMENLAGNLNKALINVHNKVKESEAVLGLLEHDVHNLMQHLGVLEQEEMIQVFQEQKEKKEAEEELARKESLKKEVEEKADLDKLLMDLGLCGSDAVIPPNPGESQGLQSFSIIEPITTHPRASQNEHETNGSLVLPESTKGQQNHFLNNENNTDRERVNSGSEVKAKEEPFAFVAEAVRLEKECRLNKLSTLTQQSSKHSVKIPIDVNSKSSDSKSKEFQSVSNLKSKAITNPVFGTEKVNMTNGNSSGQTAFENDLIDEVDGLLEYSVTPTLETLPSSSPVF